MIVGTCVRLVLKAAWGGIGKQDMLRIARQTPAEGVGMVSRAYLDDGDEMHRLNLYTPKDAEGLLPTIVDIHGGGWMYGDKDLNRNYCMYLAAQGFAVMSMSYRLLPHTDLRGQVQDVFDSLHWLEAHGKAYHCDMNRLFITGDSAGGHLTGLATCIQLSEALQQVYRVQPLGHAIRAIAISHGVCELGEMSYIKGKVGDWVSGEMLHMMFGRRPERAPWYGKASFSETAKGLPLPPVMLISSEADNFHVQSRMLEEWLKNHGARYQTKFWNKKDWPQLGHIFHVTLPHWRQSMETNDEMLDFFRRAERGALPPA